MESRQLPPVYHRLLDFLIDKATPQEILAYSDTPEEQGYKERLARGAEMTSLQRDDMEQLAQIDSVLALLKTRAAERLAMQAQVSREEEIGTIPVSGAKQERDRIDLLESLLVALKPFLSLIVGYAELLAGEPGLSGDQKNYAETITLFASRMFDQVTQIGTLANIPRLPCDFKALVERAVNALEDAARASGIAIRFDPPPGDFEILGQEINLYRMLLNLINDAIKYSSAKEDVKVALNANERGLSLSVQSTSKPLPEGLINCFPTKAVDRMPLASLDIALVKIIVEAHGGLIESTTTPDHVTEFVVMFPSSILLSAARKS